MLQVRNYYYKLKAQFQKHNPARDMDDLTQREMFQAMNSMWSLVSAILSPNSCHGYDPKIACTSPNVGSVLNILRSLPLAYQFLCQPCRLDSFCS